MMLITQLSRMLVSHGCSRCINSRLPSTLRWFSSTTVNSSIYQLKSRGLVQVKGRDTIPFLQGLVTSDVESLGTVMAAQYSMLLTVQGRVMYDLILYDVSDSLGESAILIECDRGMTDQLISDIKKYKIRKKVAIENVSDTQTVYASIPSDTNIVNTSSIMIQTPDPRVHQFGQRIISTSTELSNDNEVEDESSYHEQRMIWGISEGPNDLPPGTCFPLESNLVYMNGVSFSKGCYLGQELTARTHHTGVTRKRIMPLVFEKPPGVIDPGENIKNSDNNKNVGKFRSISGLYGLGLMRVTELSERLTIVNKAQEIIKLKAVIPKWWPDTS
ncbi:Iron-sulfur clusters incorporation protein [Mactra antiquata]